MPIFSTPPFNPNAPGVVNPGAAMPDFDQQNMDAARQRRLADFLRKQTVTQPDTKMVGRVAVSPHWLERMVPLLNQWQAHEGDKFATKAEQGAEATQNQVADAWRANMPSAAPAEAYQEGMPDVPGAQEGMPASPAIPERKVDRASILKYTLEGLKNPKTAKEAALVNQSLTSELTRAEDQEFKNQQARLSAQDKMEQKQAQIEAEQRQIQMRLEDKGLDREARERLEKMQIAAEERWRQAAIDMRREVAQLAATARASKGSGEKPKELKNLPSAQSKAWIENSTAIKNIDRAIKAVGDYPDAFGIARGLPNALGATVGNAINQRIDPKGVPVRAIVADIGSLKIHDRSGAAVTAAEFPRLVPFIPLTSDKPDVVIEKLKNFKTVYDDIQEEILNYAESQGYKSPGTRSATPPAADTPAAGGETRVIGGKTYIRKGNDWFEK